MIPTDLLLDTYGLNSAEEYWAQKPGIQYSQRLNLMKNTTYSSDVGNSTGSMPDAKIMILQRFQILTHLMQTTIIIQVISRALTGTTGPVNLLKSQVTVLTSTQKIRQ